MRDQGTRADKFSHNIVNRSIVVFFKNRWKSEGKRICLLGLWRSLFTCSLSAHLIDVSSWENECSIQINFQTVALLFKRTQICSRCFWWCSMCVFCVHVFIYVCMYVHMDAGTYGDMKLTLGVSFNCSPPYSTEAWSLPEPRAVRSQSS